MTDLAQRLDAVQVVGVGAALKGRLMVRLKPSRAPARPTAPAAVALENRPAHLRPPPRAQLRMVQAQPASDAAPR